jgi:hypothetical protein
MLLKKIGLVAAVTATFITGSAAVAFAEGDAGIGDARRQLTTSAGLEREYANRHGHAYPGDSFAYMPAYGYSGPVRRWLRQGRG